MTTPQQTTGETERPTSGRNLRGLPPESTNTRRAFTREVFHRTGRSAFGEMRALYAFRGQSLQFLLDCLLLLDSSTQTFDVGQLEEHAHLALQPVWIYGFAKVCIRARAKRSIAILDTYSGGAEYDRAVWIELSNFADTAAALKGRQLYFQHVGIEAAAVDLAQRRICIAGVKSRSPCELTFGGVQPLQIRPATVDFARDVRASTPPGGTPDRTVIGTSTAAENCRYVWCRDLRQPNHLSLSYCRFPSVPYRA